MFVFLCTGPLDVSFTSIHTAMPLAEVLRLQVLVMPNLQPPITTADAAAAYRSASQSCYSDATSCTKMHTADFVGARSRPYQSRFLHLIFLCRIFEIRQKNEGGAYSIVRGHLIGSITQHLARCRLLVVGC